MLLPVPVEPDRIRLSDLFGRIVIRLEDASYRALFICSAVERKLIKLTLLKRESALQKPRLTRYSGDVRRRDNKLIFHEAYVGI